MKFRITIFTLFIVSMSFAQKVKPPKVDLDRYSFRVSYQKLPEIFVPLENMTYSTYVSTALSLRSANVDGSVLNSQLQIFGWKKVDDSPNLKVSLNLNEYNQQGSKVNTEVVENKDKDGKVTDRYNLYQLVADYSGSAVCYTEGIKSGEVEAPKQETKTESKVNRFLQKVSDGAAKLDDSDSNNKSTLKRSFGYSYQYKSDQVKHSSNEIVKNYNLSKGDLFRTYALKFSNDVLNGANEFINNKYGYTPLTISDNLWIIDSEDEEGKIQKEAVDAVRTIFNTMNPNMPLDDIKTNIQPLIEYFDSLKTKYTGDDKGSRKIRYSAYYNLGKIYLYLDMPEKAIAEGEGLIANDYDKKDGNNIINDAKRVMADFERTKLKSRHNVLN